MKVPLFPRTQPPSDIVLSIAIRLLLSLARSPRLPFLPQVTVGVKL